jgi:hypothetical protein
MSERNNVELVKRLRECDGRFDISPDLHGEAADTIERLERDCHAIKRLANGYKANDYINYRNYLNANNRAETAEAKAKALTVALEDAGQGLRTATMYVSGSQDWLLSTIARLDTALKGDSHG